jgi:hypothetical protein
VETWRREVNPLSACIAWLRERWRLLADDSAVSPHEDSIALSVPIEVAVGCLQRTTRPREWFEVMHPHTLYGSVSDGAVELSIHSGAVQGEDGPHLTRFHGRFVSEASGARLVGEYDPPAAIPGVIAVWLGALLASIGAIVSP